MKYAYEKEAIVVLEHEPKAEFSLYHHPKTLEDNQDAFPTVSRIIDAILRRVDPTNPVLVAYLTTINPSIEAAMLLSKTLVVYRRKVKDPR